MTIATPEGKELTVEFARVNTHVRPCVEWVPTVVTWCEIADSERVLARACAVKDNCDRDDEAKGKRVAFGKALHIAAFYGGFNTCEARREVWRQVIAEVGLPKPRHRQWTKAQGLSLNEWATVTLRRDELENFRQWVLQRERERDDGKPLRPVAFVCMLDAA